jgi:broad specificity phosphatase PhoE
MVLKFVFIRHGEAQHNVDFHTVGNAAFTDPKNKDAPLTKLGIQQSQDTAKKLAGLQFLDIWSSPLQRCIETSMELFEELTVNDMYLHDSLLERQGRGYVCNERKPKSEFKDTFLWKTKFLPETPPMWIECENQTSLHHRMKAFVLWLADLYKSIDGHVLLVGHGDAIGSLTYKSLKNAEYVILTLEEILKAAPEPDVTPPPTPSPRSDSPV